MRGRMTFKRKLLEVLIQIAMLPVSALTTVCPYLSFTIIGVVFGVGVFFWEEYFLEKMKNYEVSDSGSRTYYVEPTVSFTHEGDKYVAHYDDGERTTFSPSEKMVAVLTFFALPLRIISLILSILALIIPKLNIKLKNNTPSNWNIVLDIA